MPDVTFPMPVRATLQLPSVGRAVKTGTWVHTKTVKPLTPAVQSVTITATAPANTTQYAGYIQDNFGVRSFFDVTTDGTATATELAAGIVADLQADPNISLMASNVSNAAGVVTILGISGHPLTVVYTLNPGTVLATGGTAEGSAVQFYFGRAVEITGLFQLVNGAVMQIETAEVCDSASAAANFALVLDDGAISVFQSAIGTAPVAVGPLAAQEFLVAVPGPKNWYSVVAPGGAITYGGNVYVEGAVGATAGRLYTAGGATLVQWTQARWIGVDPTDSNRAIVEI